MVCTLVPSLRGQFSPRAADSEPRPSRTCTFKVQIIEVTDEHARTGDEACEALEKLPTKDVDRAHWQSAPQKALMRIFVPAKA